jgi:lipoprotein signal peptidase
VTQSSISFKTASHDSPSGIRESLLIVGAVAILVGLFAGGAARPLIALGFLGFTLLALGIPRAAGGLLLAYVVFVPASDYGLAAGTTQAAYDLYYIGSNELNISIVELALLTLLFAVVVQRATRKIIPSKTPFPLWPAVAFTAVYLVQLAIALGRGLAFSAATNYYSGRLMFDTLLSAVLVIWLVRDEDRDKLVELLVGLITARAIFGTVRLLFFGGDPLNYYANYQFHRVSISFWDLPDAAFLAFAALYAIGRLARGKHRNPLAAPGWLALAVLSSALIGLTYRRSTVLGYVLVLAAFFVLRGLWKRPEWLFMPIAAAVIGLWGLFQRFEGQSFVGLLTSDSVSSSGALTGNRFLESASAFVTVMRYPLLGKGLAGAYDVLPLFVPFAPPTLVHNVVLFIWLKLGIAGVLVLGWLCFAVLRLVWHARRRMSPEDPRRLFLDVCLASSVLWVGNGLIGTPLIDHRHVLAMGLWLGMLLLACRVPASERINANE